MLLGALWLVVAVVSLTAGCGLLAAAGEALAGRARLPSTPIRSGAVGLAAAGAATMIAAGRGETAVGGGIPFGAAMFVIAAAFGAALLLGPRPAEVAEPMALAAPAAALVLAALCATDRTFSRGEGILLALVFLPYAAWVAMEAGRDVPPRQAVPTPGESGRFGSTTRAMEDHAPPDVTTWPGEGPDPPAATSSDGSTSGEAGPGRVGASSGEAGPVRAGAGARPWPLLALTGIVLVVGGGFALVEGTLRVALRMPLVPGFGGAAIAGPVAALPFALLVVFPGQRLDPDPPGATLAVVTGLVTVVPGLAAIVRPFELDGPATIALLAATGLYALAAAWMLLRGRGGRVLGALVLAGYAACLAYAASL